MTQTFLSPIHEPTRANALERMRWFVPEAGQAYTRNRNTDFGPAKHNNVSQLSPFLRHRLITEVEVLNAVLSRHSLVDAEKFVHEVFWRGYFKGYLEARPEIWSHYVSARDRLIEGLTKDSSITARYQTAITGQTGLDCFDAWVRELRDTGYLHNHARMWFASIWIFTLQLPWELGADFTLRHFIDGDPASNTLSWRWVGGLHTKGKTYLARPSNIEDYTNGRFSPTGLALDAPALNEAPMERSIPSDHNARNTSPGEPALLLLTGDDLHPESSAFHTADIRLVVGLPTATDRSCLPVSDAVLAFSTGALQDGLSRAASHFNAPHSIIDRLTPDALVPLAQAHGLKTILLPYTGVGPVADKIAWIRPLLAHHDIEIISPVRREDQLLWPHAKKGFFEVKNHIPRILQNLSIPSKGAFDFA